MKRITVLLGAASAAALAMWAAPQTWSGKITDSMCEKDHSMMSSGGKGPNDKDCTLACVKSGSKFLFVSDGKVYQIVNQDMPELKTFAGDTVKLTGELQADGQTLKAMKIAK